MSMTRGALMTLAREIADAVDSDKWSDALVRTWLGLVHWQEFKNVLNAQNEYTMEQFLITEDANGRFPFTDLNSGSGDDLHTHYRVQAISQNTSGTGTAVGPYYFYKLVKFTDYPTPQQTAQMPYVWYPFGDQVQLLPVQPGTQITVFANWLPQRADLLTDDDSTVTFPDGYEPLLAYMTAAHMLQKGGEETPAALTMKLQADEIREPMMQDLRRVSVGPTVFRALDMAAQWGSVGEN